jgi:hypothetical protein
MPRMAPMTMPAMAPLGRPLEGLELSDKSAPVLTSVALAGGLDECVAV